MTSSSKKISVGSDMKSPVVDFVLRSLQDRGYAVDPCIPIDTDTLPWPAVGEHVGRAVGSGQCHQGVLFCWTGTGVSMAANKIPGVRAALCSDAQTADGARRWNDANVLVMSLRTTSEAIAREILDAWFTAALDNGEDAQRVAELDAIDHKYRISTSQERI